MTKTVRGNQLFCNSSDLSRLDTTNPQIEEATIYGYSLNVKLLIKLFPNLKKLEITEADENGLYLITKNLPKLTQLDLRSCKILTRKQIQVFAQQLILTFQFSASLASDTRYYDTFTKSSGSSSGIWKEIFVQ